MHASRVAVAVVAASLATMTPGPALAAAPSSFPTRLAHLGNARQAVVVVSASWSTSYAVLRTYEKGPDGRWRPSFAPMRARIGARGFAPGTSRRQNSFTTPAGTYALGSAFGSRPNPGTRLPYRRFDGTDFWVYDPRDPATYNVLEPTRPPRPRWRLSWAERLADWGPTQYRYAAVIGYNLPAEVRWSAARRQYVAVRRADTRRGGGIFLHVFGSGATAGCVSVGAANMRSLLRWLDAAKHPRIVMGPVSAIGRI